MARRPLVARRHQRSRVGRGWVVAALVAVAAGLLWTAYERSSERPSMEGATAAGGTLPVGSVAPGIRLPATNGSIVDLGGYRGKRNVLLYFYEHAG